MTEELRDAVAKAREALYHLTAAAISNLEYRGATSELRDTVSRALDIALIDHLEADGGVEYEVWQKDAFGDDTDGMVAGSTSLADAQHYAAVYGQDGPTWIVEVTRRSLSALPVLGVGR